MEIVAPPQDRLFTEISSNEFPLLHGDLSYFHTEYRDKGQEEEWFHAFLDKYPLHFPSKKDMGHCREIIHSIKGWNDSNYFKDSRLSDKKRSQTPEEFYDVWDKVLGETCLWQIGKVLDLTTHMAKVERESVDEYNDLTTNERNEIRKMPPKRRRYYLLRRFEHLYGPEHDEDCVNLLLLTAKFWEEMRSNGYEHIDLVLD